VVDAVLAAGVRATAEDGLGDPLVERVEPLGADHVRDAFAVDGHRDGAAQVDVLELRVVERESEHQDARVVLLDVPLAQVGVVHGVLVVGRGRAADVDVTG
ncbi:hypothetical protein ADL26_02690, partial [Thermoactinomyces vulgaris]